MDQATIARHVINLSAGGKLNNSRRKHTPASQIPQIFEGFAQSGRKSMTIYFHGGMVDEDSGFALADSLLPKIRDDFQSYPVFFIWETGPFETLAQSLPQIANTPLFRKLLGKMIKHVAAKLGFELPEGVLEVAGPAAAVSEEAMVLTAIEREQLSDEQLSQLALLDSLPHKALKKATKADEEALKKDLHNDPEARAALQGIIDHAHVAQQETLEVAGAGAMVQDGSEVDYLSQAVLAEILSEVPPSEGTLELAISLPLAVWTFAGRVLVAVINRYRAGSDHGLLATVQEEIYRHAYIDRVAKIFLWDEMKQNARDAYRPNPVGVVPNDDFRGGDLFLTLLQKFIAQNGAIHLNLIGHSAGAIHISHFVQRATTLLGQENAIQNVIFWAPAVNFETFVEGIVKQKEMVKNFHLFTMNDETERKDALLPKAPFIYAHSLLYVVSGLLEANADGPLLGLARHLSGESHQNDPAVSDGRKFINSFAPAAIAFSPGAMANFTSHSGEAHGPNHNKLTLESVATIIRATQVEVVGAAPTLEVVENQPKQGGKPMSEIDHNARLAKIQSYYQQEKAQEHRRAVATAQPRAVEEASTFEMAVGSGLHSPVSNQDIDPSSESSPSDFGTQGPPTGESIEVTIGDMARGTGSESASADEVLLDAYWASYSDAATRALVRSQVESASILEVVLGHDDRKEIANTREFPWRCICSLLITAADDSSWIGTAWFVSPRLLLTAGHCVFIKDRGGWVKRIEVIPGRRGNERPFGSAIATDFHSVTGWTQNQQREFDYAAIVLPENQPLGTNLGWFGYTVSPSEVLAGLQINISGYPGDKPAGTQWFHANAITEVDSQVITYNTDTAGGQSGAPVWIAQNNKRLAVGIHTNGALTGNSATRITPAVFGNINQWKAQAG